MAKLKQNQIGSKGSKKRLSIEDAVSDDEKDMETN
jgi:hypothetical protein